MIHTIIFSKDRACQLDLTLSSYKKHFKEWKDNKVTILYTHSTEKYKNGYDIVKNYHPEFKFIQETNFRNDTVKIFNDIQEKYVAFLVDDDLFLNDISLESPEVQEFFNNEKIACVSPRLSPIVKYCYTARISSPPPIFTEGLKIWNWQEPHYQGDWNYPMSIASFHIFRKDDLSYAINNAYFRAPNSFEGTCLAANPPMNRPLMICFENTKCFCVTNNRVQTENNNFHDNIADLNDLNNVFLEGYRLSTDANKDLKPITAHGPVNYVLEKKQ